MIPSHKNHIFTKILRNQGTLVIVLGMSFSCGNPTKSEAIRVRVGSASSANEADSVADESEDLGLTPAEKNQKKLAKNINAVVKSLLNLGKSIDNKNLQIVKQCNKFEDLHDQFTAGKSSAAAATLDKIEDKRDDLQKAKLEVAKLTHTSGVNGLINATITGKDGKQRKFMDYNKQELRCLRKLATRSFRDAKGDETKKSEAIMAQITRVAVKTRLPYALSGKDGAYRINCSAPQEIYNDVKKAMNVGEVATVVTKTQAVKNIREEIRALMDTYKKETKSEKLPMPSSDEYGAVLSELCPLESDDDVEVTPDQSDQ